MVKRREDCNLKRRMGYRGNAVSLHLPQPMVQATTTAQPKPLAGPTQASLAKPESLLEGTGRGQGHSRLLWGLSGAPYRRFSTYPPPLPPAVVSSPARALLPSGCSWCRPAPGGPSRGRAQADGPGSNRHTHPARRPCSGGWRGGRWTPAGIGGSTGCLGRAPSRQVGRLPSPGPEGCLLH